MFKTNYANFVLASDHAGNFATMLDSSWSQSKYFPSAAAGRDQGSKSGELLLENAVEAIKTKRLFFESGSTNSILGVSRFPFQDCVVQAIDAADPYIDFRVSMEEMVESYGLIKASKQVEKDRNWEYLEGLLSWYLRMNEKKNHGVIVEAFIDMYAGLPSCPSSCPFSYNASASSSKSKDWWEININESSLQRTE
ncbi:Ovate protein family, C-terminal [Trema orientale]|uniref:Transcription repressor n=1 Tax=Trema orientale TaxID=63057 RepID=A0A2P5CPI9_TREOI|nr:Ovate protein family, C-terminal [Trema orientale]